MSTCHEDVDAGPTPISIARQFIKQYYPILTLSQNKLHHFYHPTRSYLSYTTSHDDCEDGTNGRARFDEVLRKGKLIFCRQAKMDLASGFIDAQKTHDGGVLIVIFGEMVLRKDWENSVDDFSSLLDETDPAVASAKYEYENFKRKFLHTFILSRGDSGSKKNLYVSNDVFRFLNLERSVGGTVEDVQGRGVAKCDSVSVDSRKDAADAVSGDEATITPQAHSKSSSLQTKTLTEGAFIEPSTDTDKVEGAGVPNTTIQDQSCGVHSRDNSLSAVEVGGLEDRSDDEEDNQLTVSESAAVKKSSGPSSWASLVAGSSIPLWRKSEETHFSTIKIASEVVKGIPVIAEKPNGKKSPKNFSKPRLNDSQAVRPPSAPVKRDGGKGIPSSHSNIATSVYIRNIPSNTKEENLSQLFGKMFPKQKIMHIAVYASRGFAFVEFANKDCVSAVMGGVPVKKVSCPWAENVVMEIEGKKTERFHSNDASSKQNDSGVGDSRYTQIREGFPKSRNEADGVMAEGKIKPGRSGGRSSRTDRTGTAGNSEQRLSRTHKNP